MMNKNNNFKYCQSQIEGDKKCNLQCEHCKQYYKPLQEMKTASEILDKYYDSFNKESETATNFCIEAMKEYAREACKEQRKIIAKKLPDTCFMPFNDLDESDIIYMDEPEIK